MEQVKRGDEKLSKEPLKFRASRGQFSQRDPEPVTGGAEFKRAWFNTLTGGQGPRQALACEAFWCWAKRHGVIPVRRAGLVLYSKEIRQGRR